MAERPADRLVATSPGPFFETPDGGEGELLAFDSRVAPALTSLAAGERITVDGWPVAPGVSRTMVLMRTEVYAPDGRIVAIGPAGEVAVPRSTWAFFQGRDVSGTARVAVALDPDTGVMRGLAISEHGVHELRPPDAWTAGRHRLAAPETRSADGTPLTWECGEEQLPLMPSDVAPVPSTSRDALAARTSLAAFTKYAVVAIDTDNELMGTKFSDNTTNATNYIANLFNQMNLIYERDVQVHLLQGYTILRLSSVTDPYTQNSNDNASGSELSEFSSYWGTHYGGVKRMVAAFLSGKQPTAFSASGIAWLGGLCSTGIGYSFSKVFMFQPDTSAGDVFITAHEIGHNFSSPHTHCYADPKPDTCFNGEGGANCFAGTPSCPASATYNGVTTTGTLMSYCHLLGGCVAGLVFHNLTISRYLSPGITGASACIFNGAAAPTGPAISGIVPPTGSTAGATSVTINGSGFVSGATAAFIDLTGSVSLTYVVFVNSGQLTAVAPAHAAGVMDVVVFNPDNSTGTLRNGYTYSAPVTNYTLSVTGGGTGQGTVTGTGINCTISAGSTSGTCSASYASGTAVSLTATATGGSTFSGWGGACSGTGGCSVTMNPNKSVSATFTPICYGLTTGVNPAGVGSVTVNTGQNCTGGYTRNTAISLTANTPAGYTFTGWSGSGGSFSSTTSNPTTFTITGTASVTASSIPTAPTASNTGPYCAGATLSLSTPTVSGATYAWTGPNGFASALQNPTIPAATTAATGTYSVTATVGSQTSAPGQTTVVVNPTPAAPLVTTPAAAGAGSPNRAASVASHAGSTYVWTIGNGTITSGQGTSQISFTAGTAGTPLTLSVTETNSSGCPSAAGNATVTVLSANSALPYYTVLPCRILDTRTGSGLPAGYGPPSIAGGGTQRSFVLAGQCGIPAGAGAVLINATVWAPTTLGDLRVFPAGVATPLVSTLNWEPNILALANFAIVQLGAGGAITVMVDGPGTVDIFFDVYGYFQ